MVSTEQSRNGDVDARLAALRAGAEGLPSPRPGTATPTSGQRQTPVDRRWIRTRRIATLVAVVILVAAASFAAGWIAATLRMSPAPASQAAGSPQPVGVAPAPDVPAPGSHSPSYTYTVQSNYPVNLGYVAVNGDQVNQTAVTTPWSLDVATSGWGADAEATVYAYASTDRGDAFVSCTITDASGKIVASDREDAAAASARCAFG